MLFLALTGPGDEACFENMPSDDSRRLLLLSGRSRKKGGTRGGKGDLPEDRFWDRLMAKLASMLPEHGTWLVASSSSIEDGKKP